MKYFETSLFRWLFDSPSFYTSLWRDHPRFLSNTFPPLLCNSNLKLLENKNFTKMKQFAQMELKPNSLLVD